MPEPVKLSIGGKNIDIHNDQATPDELNRKLNDPAQFKQFAADPKSFVANHGLQIDQQLSDQLKKQLAGATSLQQAQAIHRPGVAATLWAVASGAYSVSSTKVAVAF